MLFDAAEPAGKGFQVIDEVFFVFGSARSS